MINIVVTSKPVDGLLYYSYEYCDMLNKAGYSARVVIITHRKFSVLNYMEVLTNKYTYVDNVVYNNLIVDDNDVTLVMGRSMITLSYQEFDSYTIEQQQTLKQLFANKVISVYSENHPAKYPLAVNFYKPQQIVDLCDTEVYTNGVGTHFEKHINFSIYKPFKNKPQFKYLFLGTNEKYYSAAESVLHKYSDYGILTYDANYVNIKNNNIFVPVENLMGLFETYVYTKQTFDPAPRIIQECKYYGKDMIYERDKNIVDGGSVYWKRDIKLPDITPILNAIEKLNED